MIGTSGMQAKEMFENADFGEKNKDGIPVNWMFRASAATTANEAISAEKGALTLKTPVEGEKIFLIQSSLKLNPGNKYRVAYSVKSPAPAKYRIYLEWWSPDGKSNPSVNAKWQESPTGWREESFEFTMGAFSKNPYFVLNLQGAGEITFRDLTMKDISAADEIGDVSSLGLGADGWILGGNAQVIKMDKDKKSALLIKANMEQPASAQKKLSLTPERSYRLTYFTKATGMADTSTGFAYFKAYIKWPDGKTSNEEWLDTWANDFQKKELCFSVPSASGQVDAELILTSRTEQLFRDFSLEEVAAAPAAPVKLQLHNPYYRNTIYSCDAPANIAGTTAIADTVGKVAIELIDSTNKVVSKTEIAAPGGDFQLSKTDNLPPGKYIVRATPVNSGDKPPLPFELEISKMPPGPIEVTYRPDNIMYVNGKAFFPIVFFNLNYKNESVLYHAARSGVNTIVAWAESPEELKKTLDLAAKYNLKVILHTKVDVYSRAKQDYIPDWSRFIKHLLSEDVVRHKALFGYFLEDEAAWTGKPLDKLHIAHNLLNGLDPYRPVWSNEAPRGSIELLNKYSRACDIFGIDIYPIPVPNAHSDLDDKGITAVGKYTDICRESVKSSKPVWMILQGFSWQTIKKQPNPVYPTTHESIYMSLDAVLHGSSAVVYWGMHYIDNVDFYNNLHECTRRIAEWSPIFISGKNLLGSKVNAAPPIKLIAREIGSETYIIAVNLSDKKLDAEITADISKSSLTELVSNRKIPLRKKSFIDSFSPYAFHVYSSAGLPPGLAPEISSDAKLEKEFNSYRDNLYAKSNEYNGGANWIWYPGESNVKSSKAWFIKELQLKDQIKSARILVTADNNYKLYVNGKLVGQDWNEENGGWQTLENYDIASLLKKGRNLVIVEASDDGTPPCAMLADMTIKYGDGEELRIISDESWKTDNGVIDPEKLIEAAAINSMKTAELLSRYGDGPWGRRLKTKILE